MEKKFQFQKLLSQIKETNISQNLALRSHRASVYDTNKQPTMSTDFQKKVSLERRLRRGRNMHKPYYRTEQERLQSEQRILESASKPAVVDFEEMLG